MPTPRFSVRHDTRGTRTGAYTWTGEVQSLAHVTASTVATLITIPGRDFLLVATTACHIVFGNAGVNAASVTAPSRCFYVPANTYLHVYVRDEFDSLGSGSGSLYIRTIRNSADGTLYIAQSQPDASSNLYGATTTTSTTTSTTTTV